MLGQASLDQPGVDLSDIEGWNFDWRISHFLRIFDKCEKKGAR